MLWTVNVNVGCAICQTCWHTLPQEDISYHPMYFSSTEERFTKLCQQNNKEPQLQGRLLPLQQRRLKHLVSNVHLKWKMQAEAYDKYLKTNMMIDGHHIPLSCFSMKANIVERYQVSRRLHKEKTPLCFYLSHISERIDCKTCMT